MYNPRVQRAADALLAGGVVAYPTEAVYGLGCLPMEVDAIMRVLTIKNRSVEKGLILIGAEFEQLQSMVRMPGAALTRRILASWPGPVTWLLPAAPGVPHWLTGGSGALAVRVTDHPLAAQLCRSCDSALVSTSANRAGRSPLMSALAVRRQLGRELDYVLAGPLGGRARPSEIRDGRTGKVIRPS